MKEPFSGFSNLGWMVLFIQAWNVYVGIDSVAID
jgi:hypothetical protein